MDNLSILKSFWQLFDERRYAEAGHLLTEDFICEWPCTKESFDKTAFVKVNTDYPGKWATVLEKTFESGLSIIAIVQVSDGESHYYATSIATFKASKICKLEEYWSPIELAPEWRQND